MAEPLTPLLVVFGAYVIAVASPGPSTLRIMGAAMIHGRRAGLALAAGVLCGSLIWGLTAATGVTAVLTRYGEALVALKILGGLYLLFLAVKAARRALAREAAFADAARGAAAAPRLGRLFRQGLLMHLTNPKAVLGWVALVTLGLGPGAQWQDAATILAGCAVLGATIFGGYALVFSTAPMVRLYRRARRGIEGALAVAFGLAGLRLLASRA